jgi:uncharacterized delta-60 repeat protein
MKFLSHRFLPLILSVFSTVGVAYSQFGANDPGFQSPFTYDPQSSVASVKALSDGKMIIATPNPESLANQHLQRLLPDGSPDNTFDDSWCDSVSVAGFVVRNDGKILLFGEAIASSDEMILLLNPDGTRDYSFSSDLESTGIVMIEQVLVRDDNSLVLFGATYGQASRKVVALLPSGQTDSSFAEGTALGTSTSYCKGILEEDGSVLVGGFMTQYNNQPVASLFRLDVNGNVNPLTALTSAPYAGQFLQQQDGKIIMLSGTFENYTLLRLNADGSQDPTFEMDDAFPPSETFDMKCLDAAGRVLLTKFEFTSYKIYRLLTDGSLDPTFNCGLGARLTVGDILGINDLDEQEDGKIIIAGTFQKYNGANRVNIARLRAYSALEVYTVPSDGSACTGEAYVSYGGPAPVTFTAGSLPAVTTSSGLAVFSGLCPGTYEASATDAAGNEIFTTFVVPEAENAFQEGWPTGEILDTITYCVENCEIDYDNILGAFATFEISEADSIEVLLTVVDPSGATDISFTIPAPEEEGDYLLQIQLYCPEKSVPGLMTFNRFFVYENGGAHLSVAKPETGSGLVLSPNPATSLVTVSFEGQTADLRITDINGKQLLTGRIVSGERIPLEGCAPGVYLFTIATEKGSVVKRVVKQ